MADLISRQAAIEKRTPQERLIIAKTLIESVLDDLPSAQPEQRKGKWISDGQDIPHGCEWMHCSACGGKFLDVPAERSNFCPNCGADMRGEP